MRVQYISLHHSFRHFATWTNLRCPKLMYENGWFQEQAINLWQWRVTLSLKVSNGRYDEARRWKEGIVIINGKLNNRDAVLVVLCKLLPTHKNVLTEWVLVSHQKREMSQPVFITKKHPQAPWGKNSNIQYPFLMKTQEKWGAAGEYTVIINGKNGTISEPQH